MVRADLVLIRVKVLRRHFFLSDSFVVLVVIISMRLYYSLLRRRRVLIFASCASNAKTGYAYIGTTVYVAA